MLNTKETIWARNKFIAPKQDNYIFKSDFKILKNGKVNKKYNNTDHYNFLGFIWNDTNYSVFEKDNWNPEPK